MWGMPLLTFLSFICGLLTILIAIIWAFIPEKDENSNHLEGKE